MRSAKLAVLLATFLLPSPPTHAQDEDFTWSLSAASGVLDSTAEVSLCLENVEGNILQGYQFGVCHDEDVVSIDEENIVDGEELEYYGYTFHAKTAYDDGFTVGALFDVIMICLPGACVIDGEMYALTYDLLEEGSTDIEWCETLGDPPVTVRLIIDSSEIEPLQENGSIDVYPYFLKRGDVDGDGDVDGIIDAIALLAWAFVDGDEPPCEKAADVDDDGEITALIDAVELLEWAFVDGDAPPDPGPRYCGGDPTDDDLDCETPACE